MRLGLLKEISRSLEFHIKIGGRFHMPETLITSNVKRNIVDAYRTQALALPSCNVRNCRLAHWHFLVVRGR